MLIVSKTYNKGKQTLKYIYIFIFLILLNIQILFATFFYWVVCLLFIDS